MGSAASVLLKAQVENAKKTGVLVFTNQGYQYIPPQVLNLRHGLRLLDMSANKIAQIPERVAGLRNLKSLFLNQNRLTSLPNELGSLVRLELLSLSYNFISNLPPTISLLTNLREVKLSSNRLTAFPLELALLPCLHVVDLSLNNIEALPLKGLRTLTAMDVNLNENRLHYLGEDLWRCPRLKILRLQNNCLSLNSIPELLLAESCVSTLLLEGNLFEMKALHQLDGHEQYMERFSAARKKID